LGRYENLRKMFEEALPFYGDPICSELSGSFRTPSIAPSTRNSSAVSVPPPSQLPFVTLRLFPYPLQLQALVQVGGGRPFRILSSTTSSGFQRDIFLSILHRSNHHNTNMTTHYRVGCAKLGTLRLTARLLCSACGRKFEVENLENYHEDYYPRSSGEKLMWNGQFAFANVISKRSVQLSHHFPAFVADTDNNLCANNDIRAPRMRNAAARAAPCCVTWEIITVFMTPPRRWRGGGAPLAEKST